MKPQQILLVAALTLNIQFPAHAINEVSESRLQEVAKRGAKVMPFELGQTLHIFTKMPKGGLQQVLVKNQNNSKQVKLIQQHLSEIAAKFKLGDFSDPTTIHGENMPGLKELKNASPGAINIAYEALPNGAQITYTTENPALIQALHLWFDAQLSDHARHAMPNHLHHIIQEE